MAIGGNSTFGRFFMEAGLMMMGGLEMTLGGQVIVVGRFFMIFNDLLIFVRRGIDLENFCKISVPGRRCRG